MFDLGSSSISANDTVGAAGTVPNARPVLLRRLDQVASSNGNLCVGGTLHRFQTVSRDIFGSAIGRRLRDGAVPPELLPSTRRHLNFSSGSGTTRAARPAELRQRPVGPVLP